ncbi:glycerol transporter [Coemansia sp. Benny D115]|nr:glycerol transporter [Coemansia sp. Benny D115]
MFRSHLPAFVLAMASFVGLNRVAGALVRRWQANNVSVGGGGAVAGLWFPFVFSCVFICVLSGTSVIFIAAIVTGNYWLSKTLGGRRWAPLVFWTYGIAVLFMNETYKGYAFKQLYSGLAWLDAYRGLLRRWDIMFNITMLRMLSFAMDYHWRVGQEQVAGARYVDGCALQECETEKQRVERSRLGGDYGFINYWAYLFYPPLYLTGPIITFNNFALATWYFGQPKWSERWYFRYICSLGGAINIIAMMIANLVGFGDAGVNKMLEKIFSRQGATFLVVTYMALNVHLQVMFEWREHEYRREYYATASASEQNVELQAVSSDSTDENEAAGIPRHVVQQRPTAAKGSDALLDSSSESLDRRDHQD